jgi:hypothetical protein
MTMMKLYKRDRRDKDEGHLSNLIRRKMLQKDHGDNTKFDRNKIKQKYRKESVIDL